MEVTTVVVEVDVAVGAAVVDGGVLTVDVDVLVTVRRSYLKVREGTVLLVSVPAPTRSSPCANRVAMQPDMGKTLTHTRWQTAPPRASC